MHNVANGLAKRKIADREILKFVILTSLTVNNDNYNNLYLYRITRPVYSEAAANQGLVKI